MYNAMPFGGTRVRWLLERLDAQRPGSFEVVVVDDGSSDDCADSIAAIEHERDDVRLLRRTQNGGKFAALCDGFRVTRGRVIAFTDIDIPYNPVALEAAVSAITQHGHDLAVGDRTLPESEQQVPPTWLRRAAHHAFSTLVRWLVTGESFDTQCGFKAFAHDAGKALFGKLHERGFAGDVEVLCIATHNRLRITRIPVQLIHHGRSSVDIRRHAPRMLRACLRIQRRRRAGLYELTIPASRHTPCVQEAGAAQSAP